MTRLRTDRALSGVFGDAAGKAITSLAVGCVLVLASCGSDGESEEVSQEPRHSDPTTSSSVDDQGDATSLRTVVVAPGAPLAEPVQLRAGDAVRVVVNALSAVDMIAYLGIDTADIGKLDEAFEEPVAESLRSRSNGESVESRYGAVPQDAVLIFRSTADAWDDSLTPESALPDDANILENPSFYEIRLAWVAPVSARYWFLALTDAETEVEFVIEVRSDESVVDAIRAAGPSLFDPRALPALLPEHQEFLDSHTGPANELVGS